MDKLGWTGGGVANDAPEPSLSDFREPFAVTPVHNVGAMDEEVSQTIEAVRVVRLWRRTRSCDCRIACGVLSAIDSSLFISIQPPSADDTYPSRNLTGDARRQPELFTVTRTCKNISLVLEIPRWPNSWTRSPIRRAKVCVIVPGDPTLPGAGSFFKNPVLSESEFSI